MFDRYTEAARRAVFFGRLQASRFGSLKIEPYHLLLGAVQVAGERAVPTAYFTAGLLDELERDFADLRSDAQISTSADMPVSRTGREALAYAAEGAESARRIHIDLADVFAGLMRADPRVVETLARYGIEAQVCREELGSASS